MKIEDLSEYDLIKSSMDELVNSMDAGSQMKKMMLHICSSGGKSIRPVMLLLCTEICGGKPEESIDAALAIELIHSASLIHDDVLDGGIMRRGVESAHQKYGIPAAILCGDFLISKAISLISSYGHDAVYEFGRAGMYMAEGETIDIASVSEEFQEKNYFDCIKKKTASLFASSAAIGAFVAGVDMQTAMKFHSFGEYVGTAYQMVDDLLEYLDRLEDKQSTYESTTLPLIYEQTMGRDEVVEKIMAEILLYVNKAKALLDECPQSEAKEKLLLVADLITVDLLPSHIINNNFN
ncbi:polyprenyl synthetase family protein [Methanolobus sp. ZRKC3]|uniref:polyprenyl synthetase family protein n=1 Tax=Methanolobus sp. ZRKC3 TaxID=3125786 RepID=UPI00325355F3